MKNKSTTLLEPEVKDIFNINRNGSIDPVDSLDD